MKLSLVEVCRAFWDEMSLEGRRRTLAGWLVRWGQAIRENFPQLQRCPYCEATYDFAAWLALPVSRPSLEYFPHLSKVEIRHCPCGASLTKESDK